jgi:hypothetical protein
MARRLDSCPVDPSSGKCGQIIVEGDRIGCRQVTGTPTIGSDQPERAEARRGKAEPRPDLPCEMDDRGLTVGAGHRGDRPGLPVMEAGGETCQLPVRIGIDEDRYTLARCWREPERSGIVGQDCDGAMRNRIDGEGTAILPRAGQGGKEKAGANGSRIGAEAGDLRIETRGRRRGPLVQ